MKDKLTGLLKDKQQRGFWVWLAVLCVLAGAAAALFYINFVNGGKADIVFSLAVKGKKGALLIAAAVAVVGFVLGGAIRLARRGKSLLASAKPTRWVVFCLYALAQPLVLLAASEIPLQGLKGTLEWMQKYTAYFLWGWLWLVLVWLLMACLVNGWFAALVSGAVCMVPAIISYFKLSYRGNPVFPWDIYATGTAAEILEELTLDVTCAILLGVALWALMVVAALPVRLPWRWRAKKAGGAKRRGKAIPADAVASADAADPAVPAPVDAPLPAGAEAPAAVVQEATAGQPAEANAPAEAEDTALPAAAKAPPAKKRRPPARLWATLCAVVLLVGITWVVFFSQVVNLPVSAWGAAAHYKRLGQMTAFLNDIKMLSMEKPAGYSQAAIQNILEDMPADSAEGAAALTGTQTPHIIMVMGESFWDMEAVLTGVQFEEELLPNFHAMQAQGLSGDLLVSSLSGGTSVTEFQVLTGFTSEYFPTEYTPYMQAVRQPFFSYVQYLKAQGYTSVAMHPHRGSNWNRSTAYPFLGFDTFYARPDSYALFDGAPKERGFVSDQAVVDRMIQQYEAHVETSDTPLFLFAVTMQNHPSYRSGKYSPEEWVAFDAPGASEQVVDQLLDYATGLHSADAALGELLAYFENRDEPVLVIYYGDHMSFSSGMGDRTMLEVGPLTTEMTSWDARFLMRQVPFAAWSNQENTTQDAGLIGAYNLMPTVLDGYNLPMPQFFEYLLEMSGDSPGFEAGMALNTDGTYSRVEQMNPVQQRFYRQYDLLQYDYIFGRQYAAELFPLA